MDLSWVLDEQRGCDNLYNLRFAEVVFSHFNIKILRLFFKKGLLKLSVLRQNVPYIFYENKAT